MKVKTGFVCQQCGQQSPRWMGRCPGCGAWNTMTEEILNRVTAAPSRGLEGANSIPQPVTEIKFSAEERFVTGIGELDRVLGGGIVPGSLILVGGDPGVGKSTLLLQTAYALGLSKGLVLYVSGEESVSQIGLRAERLGAVHPNLYLLAETDMAVVEQQIRELSPAVVVIDSIQTVSQSDLMSAPGSVGQVRECTASLMRLAKSTGISIFIVGHVTKEGTLAGPRILEHMVDTVLYFEGEMHQSCRILRSVKNRFGSTNELGVFEMKNDGLAQVVNPSALFLADHSGPVAGSIVVPSLEGTRPLLVEIQALVCPTGFGVPRRMTTGVDYNRVALIMAVLEKRAGLKLASLDAYVNVVGGVKLDEPAVDLGIALALTSSFRDIPIPHRVVAIGEVGLTGEIRTVTGIEKRIREAGNLGFTHCLGPAVKGRCQDLNGIHYINTETLTQAVEVITGFQG